MRIRYFSFMALGIAGAFLVVVSQALALADIANLALGVGIGMLVVSLLAAARYRHHIPSLISGMLIVVISAWMIIASQIFSLATVQNLTFAEALAIAGVALVGVSAHELSTERVVHSLETRAGAGGPEREREFAL